MPKISEVMNTRVLSVHPDDTLEKAVKMFNEEKISGLPVVDQENKVVGVLTDRDLLKYSEDLQMIPLNYIWMTPYVYLQDNEDYKKTADDFLKTRIDEVMSKRVANANKEDSLHDAVILMKKKGVNRLPVVDDDKTLKGIITRTDLLNYLAENKTLL